MSCYKYPLSLMLFISTSLHCLSLQAQENQEPQIPLADQKEPLKAEVPEGFTTQILEPTGGKILKPDGWFYSEAHQGPSLTWILSKEDASIGRYDTGLRIQAIVGIKEKTGKSAKESLQKYLSLKKSQAKKLFHECGPTDKGLFTNMCIHVEEGPYRIFYSIFWGNDIDIAIIMTGGAKIEEWDRYQDTFRKMSRFELIDMTHQK